MDYTKAADELDNFLENQFPDDAQQGDLPDDNDDDIKEYLGGGQDDGIADDVPKQSISPPTPAALTDAERITRLERELAAAQARAATLEQSQMLQFAQMGQQQVLPKNTPPVYTPFADDELAIDDNLKTVFGDAEPYVQAVARRVAQDLYQRSVQPLEQELLATRAALENQQRVSQVQTKDVFLAQLRAVEPEIDTLAHSAEWQNWIQQPDEYGGTRTIAYHVQDGINSGNLKQVTGIIAKFRKEQQRQAAQQQQQAAPGRPAQTIPQTRVTTGRVLKQADFDRATFEFQQGRLSLDKYDKVVAAFNQAYLEGRVQ